MWNCPKRKRAFISIYDEDYYCNDCRHSWPRDLDLEERAFIREKAPMSREDAERLAREDMEKVKK